MFLKKRLLLVVKIEKNWESQKKEQREEIKKMKLKYIDKIKLLDLNLYKTFF